MGKTGLHRAAGPLSADVQSITYDVSQKEELAYNPRLKDQAIGLQAAENSALRQLEHIRSLKEKVLPKTPMVPSKAAPPAMTEGPIPVPNGPTASSQPSTRNDVVDLEEPTAGAKTTATEEMSVTPGYKRQQVVSAEHQEYSQRAGELL